MKGTAVIFMFVWCLFWITMKLSKQISFESDQTKKFFLATLVGMLSCIEESNSFQFGTELLYESSESFFSQFSSLLDGIMFFCHQSPEFSLQAKAF